MSERRNNWRQRNGSSYHLRTKRTLLQPAWFKRTSSLNSTSAPLKCSRLRQVSRSEELDVKVIQRAKKRLLHELDLNNGKVSWLDDYSLDKSHAHTLDDELLDKNKARYHWAIFQNKRLLRFLTRGESTISFTRTNASRRRPSTCWTRNRSFGPS